MQRNYKPSDSLMDDIINAYGYGKHTIIAFFCMFFTFLIQGMEFTFFSIYVIPCTEYFDLTDFQVEMISSTMSIAVCLGTFSSGLISNKLNRTLPIYIFDVVLLLSHYLMGAIKNMYVFLILRLIIGYSVGVISPMNYSIFTEYLPLKYRAFFLAFSYIGVNFGEALNSTMMTIMMPNLEIENMKSTIYLLGICIIISLILNLIVLSDSPRNLLIKEKDDNIQRAFNILDDMKQRIKTEKKPIPDDEYNELRDIDPEEEEIDTRTYNKPITNEPLDDQQKKIITLQVRAAQAGSDYSNGLGKIFNDNYKKTSSLLIGIFFFNYMNEYGLKLIYSLSIREIKKDDPFVKQEIVKGTRILYVSMISASIITGILCEIQIFGRKKTFAIANLIAFLSILMSTINTDLIFVWFSIALISIKVSVVTSNLYTAEVYNTLIRNKALGLMLALGRSGAFFSQIFFIQMHNIYVFVPFYYAYITSFINAIFSICLPFETYGKKLEECIGEKTRTRSMNISDEERYRLITQE